MILATDALQLVRAIERLAVAAACLKTEQELGRRKEYRTCEAELLPAVLSSSTRAFFVIGSSMTEPLSSDIA